MEFGMFHEFPSMPGRGETEMFDEAMEQVDAAERWGLDVMWLAEIHFAPERTYLSSPLAIAGASLLSSTTRADGFVIVGDDSEGFPAGAEVEVFLYA